MFNSLNKNKKVINHSGRSFFSETLQVNGDINSSGAIDVAGLIIGNVFAKEMTLLDTGSVRGILEINKIEINGHVDGKVTADEVILGMMKVRLNESDCSHGYILDGFPRTIPQAEGLTNLLNNIKQQLDIVILLNLDDEIIVKRMSGRRVHPESGRVYHVEYNPPKIENKDDVTGEDLIIRPDDQESTVRNRLKVYEKQTSPLIEYYNNLNILNSIEANGSIEEINNKIRQSIDSV